MNNYLELEYLDVIANLRQLKHLEPTSDFRYRIRRLTANLPAHIQLHHLPLYTARLALTLLLLIVLTGSSLVIASQRSQPGNFLYPVKILSHKLSGAKETTTVSPRPVEQSNNLAQEPPIGLPESSVLPQNVGGTEVILLPLPTATPFLEPSPTPTTTAEIEGDVHVNLNVTIQVEPSPTPEVTPAATPTTVINLPLLDVDQTESGLELKVGKEGKPFFKIGL